MISKFPRPMTETERMLCRKLLERDFPHRLKLFEQLQSVSDVIPVNDDESIVEFDVPGVARSRGAGQSIIPVEGQYTDRDGQSVTIMLFVDANDNLFQLERFKFDGQILEWHPDYERISLIGP